MDKAIQRIIEVLSEHHTNLPEEVEYHLMGMPKDQIQSRSRIPWEVLGPALHWLYEQGMVFQPDVDHFALGQAAGASRKKVRFCSEYSK